MNCHGNSKKGNKNSTLKHMIICCGLPIIIIGILPFISRISPGFARILGVVAPFICPIMMGGMLGTILLGNNKKGCCSGENDKIEINRTVEK